MTFKWSYYVKLIIWFIPFLTPVPSRIWLRKAIPAECPHWCFSSSHLHPPPQSMKSPLQTCPPQRNRVCWSARRKTPCKTTPVLRKALLGRGSQQLVFRITLQNRPASLWHSVYKPSPSQATTLNYKNPSLPSSLNCSALYKELHATRKAESLCGPVQVFTGKARDLCSEILNFS